MELSHSLLQGIFLTQGSNLGLLHCRQILYHLSHQGSPSSCWGLFYKTIIRLYSHVKERSPFRSFLNRALISLYYTLMTLLPPKGPRLQIPSCWKLRLQYLGQEDPLEKEMAPHPSTLTWRIPWTEDAVHGVAESDVTEWLHFKYDRGICLFHINEVWR